MVKPVTLLLCALMPFAITQASELKHNPFERPASADEVKEQAVQAEASVELTLGGVVLAGSNSVATVNGRIYRVGQMIDGMKLEKVDEDGATFMRNGARLRLELEEPQLGESNDEN